MVLYNRSCPELFEITTRMEEEVEDIAGIRIICQFEEDIETVASLIQNRSDMTIKSEKKYLRAAIEVLS